MSLQSVGATSLLFFFFNTGIFYFRFILFHRRTFRETFELLKLCTISNAVGSVHLSTIF